ncbi:MAG: response regulator, partial [Pseudomonadota bacterium]
LGLAAVLFKPVRRSVLLAQVDAALNGSVQGASATPAASRSDAPDLRHIRILLAEDNRTNQLVLKRMLAPSGASVTVVEDGQAAVEEFFASRPDLVLMDCSMPVLSGYDAARRIIDGLAAEGSAARMAPIIAITANAMAEDRQRCLDAGMVDFLTKPVRKDDLFAVICAAVQDPPDAAQAL